MTSRMMFSLKQLFAVVALFHYSMSADSLMGGHLDNKDLINSDNEQPMARTRITDLDLDPDLASEESIPSPSALISDGLQFRMPGLFAFNGGKPFSLEKDPITGKIDFEKAPLKSLNYTADSTNGTNYDEYDEESYVTDVQSDDIYDKKNIDRKDGSMDGTRPNEINPYSPSFHDFLNLPVHYSSGKYSKEKYPLISSSYANTKVQSGLNSYNTYNHRPYVEAETTTTRPLYFTTHKTYLPKTTMNPTTILRPLSTWSTTPSTTTTTRTTTTTTPSTTTTTTTTTTTPKPTTTTTTVPSTQKPTPVSWKPTTHLPTKPSTKYHTTKPTVIPYSTLKPPSTTQQAHDSYSDSNYGDSFAPFKPMPETSYNNKPVDANIPVSQNSHARPVVPDEYADHYDYYNFDDVISNEDASPLSSTLTPTTSSSTISTQSTTPTVEKQQTSDVPMKVKNQTPQKQGGTYFTTNLVNKPVTSHTQTAFTGPPPTSLPLGDNHPEKPFQPYTGNPLVQNRSEIITDKTSYRIPESPSNPVRFFDHPILNNVNPDLSINVNSRPYESGNGYVRPVNPNGMQQVESTSSVIIPPGQNTVSFVLGNQQNVDGGHFVGSAIRETPYGSKNEGVFQPTYNSPNVEQRPSQTITIPKKPVALASVAVNPKPIFVTEVGQNKPNLPNNIDQHTPNFNPQNRPLYPPKINGVEPPNPNPLTSFINPPPPYLETPLNGPSTVLTGTSSPVRLNIVHPQSGPSETSLNLGVRTSLNAPSLNVGTRPFQNDLVNIRNVPVEASLNLGVRPFSDSSAIIDRTLIEEDKNTVATNSNDNSHKNSQNGYVVFPGNTQDRPVEEHVIVINEADGSIQEFSPTIKGAPIVDRSQEQEDNLPKLSENLTPPEKPIDRPLERPAGSYPPRPFDGRPRPYYPPRSDYLRPPRLPPHSKPGPSDGNFKRPLLDTKLPNILPQFRPNAKASHGHHGSELIGTIPAPYGPGRQPMLGRRPPPPYLQRLSPPPLPHALRLVSDGEPGFRESAGKEGQKYQDNVPINERYQGHLIPENQRYRSPVSENQQYITSPPEKDRFQDQGSLHKRFRIPPSQNERFPGYPATESDQFSEQKLRRTDETESGEASGFERFSAEPPQIPSRPLVNRRSSADYREVPQVATLQMIQQQGGLDERVVKPNLPPPFRVKFNKDGDNFDEDDIGDDNISQNEEKRPVYVVYPVNSAVNIKDDAQNEDEGVVVGTRGPHRPLPPDTLPSEEDEDDDTVLPILRDRPLLRPQNRPFPSSPIKSDFPYPLERPDPSLLITREKPLLVPSDKIDEEGNDEENQDEDGENIKKHDDTSINVIPYLQDYMPFPMRKTETPALSDKPSKFETTWPLGESDSRIISRPPSDSETSIYRAPISATLKNVSPVTTVTPIAYAYTPTDETPEYPKLGIRPSELIEMMPEQPKEDDSNQNPILPSQQPSSSSSSAPSPQNFMAPFMASVSAEAPSSNGWSVVSKSESNDRSDVEEEEQETQTEQSEFDIENFKPQLFGGFKPIYEFPVDNDSTSKTTETPDSQQDEN